MTAREMRFMQALGEVDVKLVERAAPWKSRRSAEPADGNVRTGWWSGAKYVIGGIAAAAVLAAGAVMLHGILADAPAPYQPGNTGALTGGSESGTRVIETSVTPAETFPEPLIDYVGDIQTFTLPDNTEMPEHYADKYVFKFTYLPSSLTELAYKEPFRLWQEQKEAERISMGAYYEPITLYSFLKKFGISDAQLRTTTLYPDWINDEDIDILYSGDEELIMRTYKSDWTIMHDGMLFTPRWLYEMSVYEYMNRGLPKDEVKELALKMQSLPFTNDAWEHFCEKVEDYIGEPLSDTQRLRTEYRSEEIDGVYVRLKVNEYSDGDSVSLGWHNIELMNGKQRIGAYAAMSEQSEDTGLSYPAGGTVTLGLHRSETRVNYDTGNYKYLAVFALPAFDGGYYATLYWYDGEKMYMIFEPEYKVNSADDITLEPTNVIRIQSADGEVSYYTIYETMCSVEKLENTEDGLYTLPEPRETFKIGVETTGLGTLEDQFDLPQVYCTGINQAYAEAYAVSADEFSFDALKAELDKHNDSKVYIEGTEALSEFVRGDGSLDTDKLREDCKSTKLYYFLNDTVAFEDCLYVSNELIVFADEYRVHVFLSTQFALNMFFCPDIRTNIYWLWRLYGSRPDLLETLRASVIYNPESKGYSTLKIYVDDTTFPIIRPMIESYGSPRCCQYYSISYNKVYTMY